MVNYCCAYNCHEASGKGERRSFHKFPDDPLLRKAWCLAVRRKNFQPSEYSRICSKHFTPDSFLPERPFGHRALKKTAVPSIFDYTGPCDTSEKEAKRPCKKLKNQDSLQQSSSIVAQSPVDVKDDNSDTKVTDSSDVTNHKNKCIFTYGRMPAENNQNEKCLFEQ